MSFDPSASRAIDFLAQSGQTSIEELSPEQAQAQYLSNFSQVQLPQEAVAESRETYAGRIRLRVWRGIGAPETGARGLLYLHGGGWVIGAPETHEDICRSVANRAKAVVISPDYGLAPAAVFPTGLKQCMAVMHDLAAAPDAFGIDPARLAVAGDSAGGNLAAVLTILARDGAVPPVSAQLLLYPVTDCRQIAQSYVEKAVDCGLTAGEMAWFRAHYLPNREDWTDWRASPLLAASLAGVAPGFVALAGQDVLFDEGAAYAARLAAEARCITRSWPGQIHGFMAMRGLIPEGDEAINDMVAAWMDLAP